MKDSEEGIRWSQDKGRRQSGRRTASDPSAAHLWDEGCQGRAAQQVGNRGPSLLLLPGCLRQGAEEAVTDKNKKHRARHACCRYFMRFEAIRVPEAGGGGRNKRG